MAYRRKFKITDKLPTWDAYFVSIDLSTWLGTEEINACVFSAMDITATAATANNVVMDPLKNTFTATLLKPWVRGGVAGRKYRITMKLTTDQTSQGEFYLDFQCRNLAEG